MDTYHTSQSERSEYTSKQAADSFPPIIVYKILKNTNTQLFQYILSYFKSLLIRLYKYNK